MGVSEVSVHVAEYVEPDQDLLARLLVQVGVRAAVSPLPRSAGLATSSTRSAASGRARPWDVLPLSLMQSHLREHGLALEVIEDTPPMERIRLGLPGREEELGWFATMLRSMGHLRIPVVCCNFMAGMGWTRTSVLARGRGGALVSSFDVDAVRDLPRGDDEPEVTSQQMWANLRWFLERVVPVAEEAGVRLAWHPDDPPLSPMRGVARVLSSVEDFERLLALVPSPANAMTLCQGNFSLLTDDLPAVIRRFGERGAIAFVHFRDVSGTPERFTEVFHDEGPTDMAACLRAYSEAGVSVPLRTDHVATLEGDSNARPGYSTLGRLWAVGYVQGLLEAGRGAARASVPPNTDAG